MKCPNFNEEKKLWKRGYKYVVGLDESGRGPLAGPVVAGAVVIKNFQFSIFNFKSSSNFKILKEVRDSKQLSAKKREKIYNALIKCPDIKWGIGIVSEKVIDKINILEATKLAMKKAVKSLEKKLGKNINNSSVQKTHDPDFVAGARYNRHREFFARRGFLLLDGNMKLDINISQKAIIKADQKVFSVAAASIIAKVTRDRIMQKYHKKYPQYGFDKHKGYPTKAHFAKLQKFGACKIHRKTFWPVSSL